MVLLDLPKAFDSLNHATLLVKLQSLGLSHSALAESLEKQENTNI